MPVARTIKTISALLLVVPVVGYTGLLGYDIVYAWLKHGWASRPFVYVGIDSALVYLVYGLLYLQILSLVTRQDGVRLYRTCFALALTSIAVYWLGLLTVGIGVSR